MTESCTPATPEPRASDPAELNNLRAAHADELSSRTRATSIPADSCSLYDDEALGGTAGRATAWLALEHTGHWVATCWMAPPSARSFRWHWARQSRRRV